MNKEEIDKIITKRTNDRMISDIWRSIEVPLSYIFLLLLVGFLCTMFMEPSDPLKINKIDNPIYPTSLSYILSMLAYIFFGATAIIIILAAITCFLWVIDTIIILPITGFIKYRNDILQEEKEKFMNKNTYEVYN